MLRVSYSVTAIVATGTGPEHIMQIRPLLPCKTHRESRRRRDHRVCPCVDCRLPPRFATARNESPAVSRRSKGLFIGLCPVRFREVEIESQEVGRNRVNHALDRPFQLDGECTPNDLDSRLRGNDELEKSNAIALHSGRVSIDKACSM